ncbi:MAG TPA: hypothetical protein VK273_07610 [Gaiellaceae bacterium]|nr:hypothetical protein [Gaiellaceae bacterium]
MFHALTTLMPDYTFHITEGQQSSRSCSASVRGSRRSSRTPSSAPASRSCGPERCCVEDRRLSIRGWPKIAEPAEQLNWVREMSDHGLLFFEVQRPQE